MATLKNPMQEALALLRSRHSIIGITSHEESRVLAAFCGAAKQLGNAKVVTWSVSRGFVDGCTDESIDPDVTDPVAALQDIAKRSRSESIIWVLLDVAPYLESPQVARWLRDLSSMLRSCPEGVRQGIVLLGPVLKLPPSLEKDVSLIDWPLPTLPLLGSILDAMLGQLPASEQATRMAQPKSEIIAALAGLTALEAENAVAKAFVSKGKLDAADLSAAKAEIVAKSGTLEIVEPPPGGLDDIQGYDYLKSWLGERRMLFAPEARAAKVDVPRGMILVGPPGTGKSSAAKAISTAWRLPLVRLDVGALMGGIVGESEANTRSALKIIRAVSPCVVWCDEIEKMLSGAGTDSSGVTGRILGALLTAMAEADPERPVYWVLTANDVRGLRPELFRAGRLDATWFVDLPNVVEREQIGKLHLARRGVDVGTVDVRALALATESYSGAEIEQAVKDAKVVAYAAANRAVTTEDLISAARGVVPMAVTAAESIADLRKWAKGRAKFASTPLGKPDAMAARMVDISSHVASQIGDIPEGGN